LDLREERQQVIQALLELDCIPAGMELFPASDEGKWELIERVIDDSDYYVVVIGGRYGSTDDTGLSYTEREYDYAVSRKVPALGFVHANPELIPVGMSEKDPDKQRRLDGFRSKVETRMCQKYTSPEDLGGKVSRSLTQAIKRQPAEGWIRGRFAADETLLRSLSDQRAEIATLTSQLEAARTKAPEGIEDLKQGDDTFEVVIEYGKRWDRRRVVVSMTWDHILYEAGPMMLDEASEEKLREALGREIIFYMNQKEVGKLEDFGRDREVVEDSLHTIKLQLAALGLIERSNRKRQVRDTETYWKLTRYGEHYVMRLRALRRSDDDETEDATS